MSGGRKSHFYDGKKHSSDQSQGKEKDTHPKTGAEHGVHPTCLGARFQYFLSWTLHTYMLLKKSFQVEEETSKSCLWNFLLCRCDVNQNSLGKTHQQIPARCADEKTPSCCIMGGQEAQGGVQLGLWMIFGPSVGVPTNGSRLEPSHKALVSWKINPTEAAWTSRNDPEMWVEQWNKLKTRWSPRTRMPTRMLRNKDLILICHNFQRTHLWNTLIWHTEVTLL